MRKILLTRWCLTAFVFAMTLVSFGTQEARAQSADVTSCVESDVNTYSPGITLAPHQTQISSTGTLSCVSLGDPTLTSGRYSGSGTGTVSCTGGTFDGSVTYHWNNGQDSTVSYTGLIGTRLLGETVVLYKGTVTDGEFKGASYTSPLTALNLAPLNCVGQGVTATAGPTLSLLISSAAPNPPTLAPTPTPTLTPTASPIQFGRALPVTGQNSAGLLLTAVLLIGAGVAITTAPWSGLVGSRSDRSTDR